MDSKNFLIVGLGNPGQKYELTRHNIGFLALDYFLKKNNSVDYKEEKKSLVSRFNINNLNLVLAKPQTFMNLSGESVQPLMAFYKIPKENLLVLHDDIDIPFGALRFQFDRSPGGHNGIKNIHEKIGSAYSRLKIGVLGTKNDIPTDRYVLMNFEQREQEKFNELFESIYQSILCFIEQGLDKAANQFNRKNGFFN